MNCADQSESKYDTEIEPTRLCIKQIKVTEFEVLIPKIIQIQFFFFLFFLSASKFQKKKKYIGNWETGYNITKSLLYRTKFSGSKCLG